MKNLTIIKTVLVCGALCIACATFGISASAEEETALETAAVEENIDLNFEESEDEETDDVFISEEETETESETDFTEKTEETEENTVTTATEKTKKSKTTSDTEETVETETTTVIKTHSVGWESEGNKKVYYNANGEKATGEIAINGEKYFFDKDGKMLTGWHTVDGKRKYFSPETGKEQTGFIDWHDGEYYADGSGKKYGWENVGDYKYYFDNYGKAETGMKKIGTDTYYFDDKGRMQKGKQTVDKADYYFAEDGKLCTGWKKIDGENYYFGDDGKIESGLKKIDNETYYLDKDGKAQKGKQTINKENYYFAEDGKLYKGWKNIDGEDYYFGDDGKAYKDVQEIDGKKYLFSEDGKLRKNVNLGDYYTDEKGELHEDTSFAYPTTGFNVSSRYGFRWGTQHKGYDFATKSGTPITASRGGKVVFVSNTCRHNYAKSGSCGCGGGYGNYVIIEHDGTYSTLYGHMATINVSKGQEVKKGEQIGTVGSTGHSTGFHCHFEIRVNGKAVNPGKYLPNT